MTPWWESPNYIQEYQRKALKRTLVGWRTQIWVEDVRFEGRPPPGPFSGLV